MKQTIIITVLILIAILIGCSSNTQASGSVDNHTSVEESKSNCVYEDEYGYRCMVDLIKIKGHEYLVSYTNSERGGTCIIHAAHCPCNNH